MSSEYKIDHKCPFSLFKEWFNQAIKDERIVEPTAMCLSTINSDKKPSSRMVLLKKFDNKGFYFFTNLESRKGQELKINKFVALCFYWGAIKKQIRIEGVVEKISNQEADEYFLSRPYESKVGAWASKQSQKMNDWQEFMDRIQDIKIKFKDKNLPRPDFWSGFRVVPSAIEFWEEGEFRIHQRYLYEKTNNDWIVNQLYP